MKRKYETRCWLCGSNDLEPNARGIRCRSCGATFNLFPKPSQYPITLQEDLAAGGKTPSPSSAIVNRTAKVRNNTIH